MDRDRTKADKSLNHLVDVIYLTFTHAPLAKANHLAKSRVLGSNIPFTDGEGMKV